MWTHSSRKSQCCLGGGGSKEGLQEVAASEANKQRCDKQPWGLWVMESPRSAQRLRHPSANNTFTFMHYSLQIEL